MNRRKLPKYVHAYLDRHGRPRHYLRRRGHKHVSLPGLPWSPEFMTAYTAALGNVPPPSNIGADRVEPGTMAALVAHYYGTADFAALAENTKTLYRGICERLRNEHGHRRVAALQFEHVEKMLKDREDTKTMANAWLRMLRVLMKLAIRLKLRTDDPTQGVKQFKIKTDGIHSWSEAEIEQFEAVHAIGTRARLAFAMLLYTGQRRSDVIRMGRQHVRNGHLTIKQQKTNVEVCIPVHATLAAIIAATPNENLTFLTTRQGKPFCRRFRKLVSGRVQRGWPAAM
jgi:integrase